MPPPHIPPRPPVEFTDTDILIPPVKRQNVVTKTENGSSQQTDWPSPSKTAWLTSPAGSATIAGSVIGVILLGIGVYVLYRYVIPEMKFRRSMRDGSKNRKEDTNSFLSRLGVIQNQAKDKSSQAGSRPTKEELKRQRADLEKGIINGTHIGVPQPVKGMPGLRKIITPDVGVPKSPPDSFPNPLRTHPPGQANFNPEAHYDPVVHERIKERFNARKKAAKLGLPVRETRGYVPHEIEETAADRAMKRPKPVIPDDEVIEEFVEHLNQSFGIGEDSDDE